MLDKRPQGQEPGAKGETSCEHLSGCHAGKRLTTAHQCPDRNVIKRTPQILNQVFNRLSKALRKTLFKFTPTPNTKTCYPSPELLRTPSVKGLGVVGGMLTVVFQKGDIIFGRPPGSFGSWLVGTKHDKLAMNSGQEEEYELLK